MKPNGELTRLGQLRRMRRLGEAALDAYGLGGARLTFLRYFANSIYRVDVPNQGSRRSEPGRFVPNRYLLRILLSGHWEYAKGEMTWLAALSREAESPVPEPVPTLVGELLTRIATPVVPEGRLVSLMRRVDGRQLSTGLQLRHFRPWGDMVGRLHAFAAGWTRPVGFQRFVWDWEGLLGGRDFGYGVEELVDSMPERLREPFQSVSQATRAAMKELGRGPDAYGMVHGDMYPDNILFKHGEVFPIDFEDCGFGYWLWDIAVALSQQPWTETWYRQREAFLNGYAQFHPLPKSHIEYLNLFVAANCATGVLWPLLSSGTTRPVKRSTRRGGMRTVPRRCAVLSVPDRLGAIVC